MERSSSGQTRIRFGVFEIDFAAAELRKRGRKVRLEAQPFQVLGLLLRRAGELVTREEIRDELWPEDTFVEVDHSLNTAVKKIRQALDDSARHPHYIETAPRQGYRFIGEVDGAEPVTAPEAHLEQPAPSPAGRRPLLWIGALAAVASVAIVLVWLVGRKESQTDEPLRVEPLTTYPGDEQRPSFSPDGNEVAFQWNRDGNWDIYVKQIGVEKPFQLTNDPADELGPAWSPLGDQIAFVRVLSEPPRMQVILTPQRGGPGRVLTEFRAHLVWNSFIRHESGVLAWTPDGEWLVVAGRDDPQELSCLFRLSTDTGERVPITSPKIGEYGDVAPAVSPDGRTLVFVRDWVLWTVPLEEDCTPGGSPERLPSSNADNYPAWTGDGREIVFSRDFYTPILRRLKLSEGEESEELFVPGRICFHPSISVRGNRMAYAASSRISNIWQVDLSKGEERLPAPVPLIASTRLEYEPAYSPDGQRIAFNSLRSGNTGIWVSNSGGEELAELVPPNPDSAWWRPRWSPNGEQIVFSGRVEGNVDLYTVKSSGGVPRRLTTHPGEDGNPEWSRNGEWIYFLSHRDGTKRTWKIPADGGEPVPMEIPGGVAVESPDGKFLYYEQDWETPEKHSIWRVSTEGGEAMQVADSLSRNTSFDVVDDGIYYVGRRRDDGTSRILFKNAKTRELQTIADIEETTGWGLTVSPDRKTLLYVQEDGSGSDLMLVENFR